MTISYLYVQETSQTQSDSTTKINKHVKKLHNKLVKKKYPSSIHVNVFFILDVFIIHNITMNSSCT